jgi:CelD/BcsL family acetyltransferase involved in cellulose biosynthesis
MQTLDNTRIDSAETVTTLRPLADLSAQDLREWAALAERAAEPNPFQHPAFILPQANLLPCRSVYLLSTIQAPSRRMIATWAVEGCEPTLTRPLPHLRSFSSLYSFCDVPLVDREQLSVGLRSLWTFLAEQRRWHGVRLRFNRFQGDQADAFHETAAESQVSIDHDRQWTRAFTQIDALRSEPLLDRLSRSRRKSLNRARRWMQSCGALGHRLVFPRPDDMTAAETFLRLESLGWKGAAGTSIASRPGDAAFFREMIRRFASIGGACFGELLIGQRVIASTCNLLCGNTLFGFKLGWDPEFANGSPGVWSELELARAVEEQLPEVTGIDSCAQPGSYVDSVSNGTTSMSSTVCVWSRRAQVLCEIRRAVHSVRQAVSDRFGTTDAALASSSAALSATGGQT